MVKELRLRWSPLKRGLFVIPGDDIIESGAQPFRLSADKLADPDLFSQAAMDHNWPRLTVEGHRDRIVDALAELGVSSEHFARVSIGVQSAASVAVMKMLDAETTVEECLSELEDIAA